MADGPANAPDCASVSLSNRCEKSAAWSLPIVTDKAHPIRASADSPESSRGHDLDIEAVD
jgi:hypothetical protein